MNRIALILTMALFCLSMSAQIQRKFFGLELGVSTKQQIEAKMTEMGETVQNMDGENLVVNKIRFGGKDWDYVIFKICDNKFASVVFGDEVLTWNGKQSIMQDWDSLKSSLKEKYADYCVIDKEDDLSFFDLKTMASLSYKKVNYKSNIFTLLYSDFELMAKLSKSIKDEL